MAEWNESELERMLARRMAEPPSPAFVERIVAQARVMPQLRPTAYPDTGGWLAALIGQLHLQPQAYAFASLVLAIGVFTGLQNEDGTADAVSTSDYFYEDGGLL